MDRRRALKLLGGSLAAATGLGVCARELLPPAPSASLKTVEELARELVAGLDDDARTEALVGYDHPLRQCHNTGRPLAGAWVLSLPHAQRQRVVDLLHVGLTEEGRRRVPREEIGEYPGVHAMRVLVCGDPHEGPSQVLLTGPHLNLRVDVNRPALAPTGVQVYGDQRGNAVPGIPGNLYRDHWLVASSLYASLDDEQRRAATMTLPHQAQTCVAGAPRGVPVSALGVAGRAHAKALVEGMRSLHAVDASGAPHVDVDLLSVAFELHAARGDVAHVRLEGASSGGGCVMHMQCWPHVHAFVNAWSAGGPLSLGAVVAENPTPLEGAALAAFYERVLRATTGVPRARFDVEGVAGAFPAGVVREGDVWATEMHYNRVVVAHTESGPLATTDWLAENALEGVRETEAGPLMRDAVVAYVKKHGFA